MPAARATAAEPEAPPEQTPPSFEHAMERLEAVVEQMENSKLPLEELIRCYEEGTRLIQVCSERLSVAEQRIEIITRDAASGETRVADYSPAPSATAAAPATKPNREGKPAPDQPASPAPKPVKNPNEVSLF